MQVASSNLPKRSSKAAAEDNSSYLEKGLRMLIDTRFERSDLFQVWSEHHIYKTTDDAYIVGQRSGKIAEVAEVRFLGEWLCDISETETPDQAFIKITESLAFLKNKMEQKALQKGVL